MKTVLYSSHNPATPHTLADMLQAFRQAYTLEEVQQALRHCQLDCMSGNESTPKNHAMYAHLEVLLSALYHNPLPAAAPIASALDTLHHSISTSWVLLISPPE
jgi:hypothetical protein